MKSRHLVSLLACLATPGAGSRQSHLRLLQHLHGVEPGQLPQYAQTAEEKPIIQARADPNSTHPRRFLNEKTQKFVVDGAKIPEVDFDVGESYAGLLPISDKKNERDHLYFWFFPTDNEEHREKKEITLWLNGGPGCSSLLGLLQENGPFVWRPGTLKPVANPWSWHHLTNVVWVEQPVTIGFSTGNTTIHNEDELAEQFKGFWKNFIDTFGMQGWKIYVVGESYGGYYGPYISSHFLDAKDTKYFGLEGLMIVDGLSFDTDVQSEVTVESYVEQNYNLMPFDDATLARIRNVSKTCGYRDYLHKYYRYPPSGPQPTLLPWAERLANGTVVDKAGCGDLWYSTFRKATFDNPCFNVYNTRDYCPFLYDPLDDKSAYFNRTDVKKAINAPLNVDWHECVDTAFVKNDESRPPSTYELPNVIDKTKNVILVLGGNDFILTVPGILLGVQNMTWGGKLGFQSRPSDPFYVPRFREVHHHVGSYGAEQPDKSGVVGTSHHERGLTIAVTVLAGHEAPQYSSTSTFRQLEKLLGRVHSLSDTTPFTLTPLRNISQDPKPLGRGTYPIPFLGW